MTECRFTSAVLTRYLDGESSLSEREKIEQHLNGCAQCSRELEEMQKHESRIRDLFEAHALPEDFTKRIIDRLPEKRAAGRRFFRIWAGAAAVFVAATALSLFFIQGRQAEIGTFKRITGRTEIFSSPGQEGIQAERGTEIRAGDTVRTGTSARSYIALFDGSRIKLNSGTEMEFGNVRKGVHIRLSSGEIWVHTPPRKEQFIVETATASVTVKGTEFDVKVAEHTTVCTVIRGMVEFSCKSGTVELEANTQGAAGAGITVSRKKITDTKSILVWTEELNDTVPPPDVKKEVLKLELTIDKMRFKTGEPVRAEVKITNISERTVYIPVPRDFFVPRCVNFRLKNPAGGSLSVTPPPKPLPVISEKDLVQLPPNEFYGFAADLSEYFACLKKPGTYTIQAVYTNTHRSGIDAWTGTVQSNIVTITVEKGE